MATGQLTSPPLPNNILQCCRRSQVELTGWLGFFLMSCGPNGLFILCVSLANLVPRAVATHRWYVDRFGTIYVKLDRKYLIPGVW